MGIAKMLAHRGLKRRHDRWLTSRGSKARGLGGHARDVVTGAGYRYTDKKHIGMGISSQYVQCRRIHAALCHQRRSEIDRVLGSGKVRHDISKAMNNCGIEL